MVRYCILVGVPALASQHHGCDGGGNKGCSAPQWEPRWSMAESTYAYCFNNCPLPWLANHTDLGVYGGVVGYDHYYTKQGMPCVNGQPREFALQDEMTTWTKTVFPKAKVLQYRILDAVPYDPVVKNKMLSDPDYFIRWHHGPDANGSICENHISACFNDPTRINNPALLLLPTTGQSRRYRNGTWSTSSSR